MISSRYSLGILIIILILFFILYYHNKLEINNKTYFNIVKKLNFPDFFKYYNPSGFIYNNKLYTTHRIHFQPNRFYHPYLKNKSFISISRENSDKVIYVNVPQISNLVQYQNFTKNKNYHVLGYEDVRAFILDNKLYMLANTFAYNELHSQMCLIKFNLDQIDLEKDEIISSQNVLLLNPSLNENKSQKNWMPLIKDEKLFLIYSINPMTIYECNVDNGNINLIFKDNINQSVPTNLRGSSNLVEYYSTKFNKKVYICVCHIKRITFYTHLFIILDNYSFKVLAISDEFIIDNNSLKFSKFFCINSIYNIQFISSILLSPEKDNNLIVFYGENDKVSKRFEVNLDKIEKRLKLV